MIRAVAVIVVLGINIKLDILLAILQTIFPGNQLTGGKTQSSRLLWDS